MKIEASKYDTAEYFKKSNEIFYTVKNSKDFTCVFYDENNNQYDTEICIVNLLFVYLNCRFQSNLRSFELGLKQLERAKKYKTIVFNFYKIIFDINYKDLLNEFDYVLFYRDDEFNDLYY